MNSIAMQGLVAVVLAAACVNVVTGDTAFDWGRPCTLTTSASKTEIEDSCTDCGSGATAKPTTTCAFKDITIPASSTIDFSYHSSVHNLYVGSSPCAYTTEICPAKDAAAVSTSSPCKYSPGKAGVYYISDKQNDYCNTFDAHLKVTAT